MDQVSVGNQRYAVGCKLHAWIYKLNVITGDYHIFRDGSLVSSSR